MHRVSLELRDEDANVLHALRVEPAPFHAAPDGEQIGLGLVGADELMAAFVAVDVELHLTGQAADLVGVEDEEAGKGAAPRIEIGIEHRRPLAAIDRLAVDAQRAVWNHGGLRASLLHVSVNARSRIARTAAEYPFLGLGATGQRGAKHDR